MPNLQIDTGEIHIDFERDGNVVGQITFNPKDVLFAEKFYLLVSDFNTHFDAYVKRAEKVVDEANLADSIGLVKEACLYIRSEIDKVFGEGTSQIAFGETLVLEVFPQFFEGLSPYFNQARIEKISKYIPPVQKPKRVRRK